MARAPPGFWSASLPPAKRSSLPPQSADWRASMNKILLGVLLGAVLGAIDGATAWFTPEVRPAIVGIIIGGAIKSIIVGAILGVFARKVHSVAAGLVFGLVLGAGLAFVVAQLQHAHYVEIIVPGSVVGMILGFVTQRYGAAPAVATAN